MVSQPQSTRLTPTSVHTKACQRQTLFEKNRVGLIPESGYAFPGVSAPSLGTSQAESCPCNVQPASLVVPSTPISTSRKQRLGQEQWGSTGDPQGLEATEIFTAISDFSLLRQVISPPPPQIAWESAHWIAVTVRSPTRLTWSNFVPSQSMNKWGD